MLLEDIKVVFNISELRSITAAARRLRGTIKKKCTDILTQLVDNGILVKNVLD